MSVGNNKVKHAAQYRVPFFLFFGGRPQLVVELEHLCEVNNLYSAQGNWSHHIVFKVRHPRGSYTVIPMLSQEVAIPENTLTH